MDAIQQHMFDAYRAARRGEPAPPAPGSGDLRAVREARRWREFVAVVDERAAARRARARARRAALVRLLRLGGGRVPVGRTPGQEARTPGQEVRSAAGPRLPSGRPGAGRRA
ncbi:hypothetical protein AB0I22_10835 [Streptomyces sp. NPDC050610]|uniref:hypothetical protein n=1 Tax=Streptomyces sp. NPDC050610 TaxID=3157097 RepID=UPI00343646E7